MVKASAQITMIDLTDITVSNTPPLQPTVNQLWLDTSVNPSILKRYNGSLWEVVNDYTEDLEDAIDGIEIGGRNLLLGSQKWDRSAFYFGERSPAYIYDDTGYYSVVTIPSGSTTAQLMGIPVKQGDMLTISIDVKYTNYDNTSRNLLLSQYYVNDSRESYDWGYFTDVEFVTEEWQSISFTQKIPKDCNYVLGLRTANSLSSVSFRACKIEKGNKATDWTPAPEDVEEKIETNTTAITVEQGRINGLISENTIIKGNVTTLSNNYTSLNATVNGINTTVGSHTTSIANVNTLADSKAKVFTVTPTTPYKIGDLWVQGTSGEMMRCKVTRATGSYTASDWEKASKYTDDTKANAVEGSLNTLSGTVTTVSNKQTALEQNLDGFKTTVSSNYSTKTELNATNSNVSSVTTRVSNAESSITQLNKSIALKVESSDITTAINNVEIGGRNLLLASGIPVSSSVYNIKNYTLTETIPNGTQVTLSIKGLLGTGKTYWGIYNSGGSVQMTTLLPTDRNAQGVYTKTFNWVVGTSANTILYVYQMPNGTVVTSNIDWIKLEKGNKATDWTPAPEDINSAISTVSSKAASLEVDVSSITSRVSSVESTNNTNTNNIGNLTSRVSAAEQKITSDAIVSTVRTSTSYTTDLNAKANQSALNTTNNNLTSVTNRVSTAESSITQLNNKIALKVEASDVETQINNNRGKVASFRYIRDWLNGSNVNTSNHWVELKVIVGGVNIVKNKTPTGSVALSNPTKLTDEIIDSSFVSSISDGWQWVQLDLGSIRTDIDTIKVWHYYIDGRAYNNKLEVSSDGVNWITLFNSNINGVYKETVEGRTYFINDTFIDGSISTVSNKVAEILLDTTSITNRVSSVESTNSTNTSNISGLTSRMSSAEQKITSNAIISTVQSTINTAKTDAINSANTNTTNALKSYSTTTQMNTAITQSATSIASTVSSTYATKTELNATNSNVSSVTTRVSNAESSITQLNNSIALKVEASDITTAIDGVQVGGRNYIKDYLFEKSDVWLKSSANIDTVNKRGQLTGTTGTSWLYQEYKNNEFKVGDKLTFQYEMKCEGVSGNSGTNSFLVRTQLTGYKTDGTHIADVLVFKKHESDYSDFSDWKKVTTTGVVGNYDFDFTRIRLYARNFNGKIYFRNVKLEIGDKATDLSPAPEDVNSDISAIIGSMSDLTSRVSTAEQKILPNAIISTVQSTINTAKTDAINSANTNTTNALKSYSTTTQMNTAITQSATSVKTEVSNTYINKIDASSTYATKSSMELTANQLKLDFTSSGGYNFVKNSNFQNGTAFWTKVGSPSSYASGKYRANGYGDNVLALTTTAEGQQAFQSIEGLQIGRRYTVSCYIYIASGSICMMESNYWSVAYTQGTGWQWLSLGFTANANSVSIFIGSNSYAPKGSSHITAVSLTEGWDRLVWTPHPNEIYNGNTTIDADGVGINNGALKVTNSNGTTTIDGSKLMLRVLTYGQGSIVIPNGSQTATVTITHNLGFIPIFKGQIGYINTSGGTEYYSDSLSLYKTSDGTANYNVRMFVTTKYLQIIAWRAASYINSGTQTFYYRYFIEEGVNF